MVKHGKPILHRIAKQSVMLNKDARVSCGQLIRIQTHGSEDSAGSRLLEQVMKPSTEPAEESMFTKEYALVVKPSSNLNQWYQNQHQNQSVAKRNSMLIDQLFTRLSFWQEV
jgi:hypothetical protein